MDEEDRTPGEQCIFDTLTAAIAEHNTAIANTVLLAQESLSTARKQLTRAEEALDVLKKYIVEVINGDKK